MRAILGGVLLGRSVLLLLLVLLGLELLLLGALADAGEGGVDFGLGEVLGAEEGDLGLERRGGDRGVLEDWGGGTLVGG